MKPSPPPNPDTAIQLQILEKLYPAVVADVLDELGFRRQTLPPFIRPLTPTLRISGRIFPARAEAVKSIPANPYKLEIAAVETMTRGDVLVIDADNDQSCGIWGELLTTACMQKGIRGVVMTACTRDVWKLKALDFPVFGIGYNPADSKGRADIVEIGEPIKIGSVKIKRGDLLLGDEDGLVIVPQEAISDTLRLARKKTASENIVRARLAAGMPMGEAFRKYGVL